MKRSIRIFTVSALAAGIAACGGSGDGSSTSTSSTGTVNVGLTDAPVDSAQEVNIEVEALVRVRHGRACELVGAYRWNRDVSVGR